MRKYIILSLGVCLLVPCSCAQPEKSMTHAQRGKNPRLEPSVTMEWEGEAGPDPDPITLEVAYSVVPCDPFSIAAGDTGEQVVDKIITDPRRICDLTVSRPSSLPNRAKLKYKGPGRLEITVKEGNRRAERIPRCGQKLELASGLKVSIVEEVLPPARHPDSH